MRAAILTCLGFSPVAAVTTTHELCGAVHELCGDRDKLHELCGGGSAADEMIEFVDMETGLKVQTTVPYQAVGYSQHAVNVKHVGAQTSVPEPAPGIDHRARKLQSACAPGTTASYAGETLAFRFRSEDISTDANGLRWNAVVPPGLAFTMVRPPDPVADATGGWYSGENSANMTEPSTSAPPGVAEGIHFESDSGATYDQMMVSNQKVARQTRSSLWSRQHLPRQYSAVCLLSGPPTHQGCLAGSWAPLDALTQAQARSTRVR
jgi:hypothetical protein